MGMLFSKSSDEEALKYLVKSDFTIWAPLAETIIPALV